MWMMDEIRIDVDWHDKWIADGDDKMGVEGIPRGWRSNF